MSNEPVKLEVDCAVAPYSHHHHHPHHLPPHQNSHLQHHHNPHLEHEHLEVSSPPYVADERTSNEDDEGEYLDEVDEEELIENEEQKVHLECNEGQMDGLTKLVKGIQAYSSKNSTTNGNLGELTQLENVVNQAGLEHCKKAPKDTHHAESISPPSSSTSGNSDISESEDDDDDEDADDDSEEEEDSDVEEDDDEGEDEEEYDEEIDDDDIVDPVGHQPSGLSQRIAVSTNGYDCNGTNMSCYDRIKNNHESSRDEDVSFDHEMDEQAQLHDFSSPVLLDSERMLEVTRKLVRSTERDPDRDLRKQVLLRTAIRKLPQFMEYNNYSKSFDQSFQMHNNTLETSNASLTCMSPAQYYEHNHLGHQMDMQPKSYYHSVQPNAIQMSTTSLRMLDLNDDTESETITSLEPKHHQSHVFENHSEMGNNVNQNNLEQRQLEYASHQIYDQHYANLDAQPNSMIQEHNSQGAIHDFSQYESHESNESMITRHSTIENLYQPLASSDMSDDMKGIDQSSPFESGSDYSRVTSDFEVVTDDELLDKSDINDNMINTTTQQIANVLDSDKDDTITSIHRDISDHSYHQDHDCNQNQTDTTAFYDSNETQQDSIQLENFETPKPTSPNYESNETNLLETIEALEEDQSGCSEGGSSNSSQSSTTSDDSLNSSSSQSNDSAGDLSGISMLETSLNTTADNRFNYSHDSGVALFSPKSNKRSSSSIGLDDEMDIDHLTDLTSSNQFNSSGTVSTLNQCKRMRKREIMD